MHLEMEGSYHHHHNQVRESAAARGGGLLYESPPVITAATSSGYGRNSNSTSASGGSNGSNGNYHPSLVDGRLHPFVKCEVASTSQEHDRRFYDYPNLIAAAAAAAAVAASGGGYHTPDSVAEIELNKAKIIAHPRYSNLLGAFLDCQKVGAPAELAERLEATKQELEFRYRSSICTDASKDPELDQFMEAYHDMLVKYREELERPLQEAMEFMSRIESQLNLLANRPSGLFADDRGDCGGSSEEDTSYGETDHQTLDQIDPRAEDRELKNHLLRRYSGLLSSLKQELSKKKKKGKLPKEARQKLLTWWEVHYKWPYPSETEKITLAESTGLDQKQINNWFINQRKRHWKPSEESQFVVVDGVRREIHPSATTAGFYVDGGHYRVAP